MFIESVPKCSLNNQVPFEVYVNYNLMEDFLICPSMDNIECQEHRLVWDWALIHCLLVWLWASVFIAINISFTIFIYLFLATASSLRNLSFPYLVLNPRPLQWSMESWARDHQGSPSILFLFTLKFLYNTMLVPCAYSDSILLGWCKHNFLFGLWFWTVNFKSL